MTCTWTETEKRESSPDSSSGLSFSTLHYYSSLRRARVLFSLSQECHMYERLRACVCPRQAGRRARARTEKGVYARMLGGGKSFSAKSRLPIIHSYVVQT